MNSGLWWMGFLSFSTTCFLSCSSELYLVTGSCPTENHICNCDVAILNCTCGPKDHLVIERFNDTDILGIQINGCKRLTVQPIAFKNFEFEFVYIGDIEILVLDRLAFFASYIEFFEIANIADFRPKHYSLSGMANVSSMVIENVTTGTFPRHFVLDVDDLLIIDSQIGIIQSYAFMMIQNLTMMNCTLDLVQSNGFFLRNSGQSFSFLNNTVMAIDGQGFQFGPWYNISLVDCSFGELSSTFGVGKRLNHFRFSGNRIQACEVFAFQSLHATESFIFYGNHFDLAEIYSLPALYYLPADTTIEKNHFSCNCEISWLWQNQTGEEHDIFMNSNYCSDDLANVTLDQLNPVFDKDDVCQDLISTTTTTSEPTTIEQVTTGRTSQTTEASFQGINFSDKVNNCPGLIIFTSVICLAKAFFCVTFLS